MTTHRIIHVAIEVEHKGRQTIAATVHLPGDEALERKPPVLTCFPGAGYNRHYFDLPVLGYSEAAYHAADGLIVVAIDHLGVGESSIPDPESTRHGDIAAANHAALTVILAQIRSGAVDPTRQAAVPRMLGPVIGVGHSMGGHIAVVMQASYKSFDAIALLGASMARNRLPSITPWREVKVPAGTDPVASLAEALHATDWRVAGHWEDVPTWLVDKDMDRTGKAPWHSATIPNVGSPLQAATVAREAAAIDVPVLLGVGEGDVCRDPLRELAVFHESRDITFFEVPRMAHLHNFAGTRALLWRRVEAFSWQCAMFADGTPTIPQSG